jgi:hypothetical protein
MDLISLLVTLLIIVLVAGVAFWIIKAIGLPDPWGRIALVIVGVIVLIYLIGMLTGGVSTPALHLGR